MKGVLLGLYIVAYSAFTLLGSDGEQYSYKRQNTHVLPIQKVCVSMLSNILN